MSTPGIVKNIMSKKDLCLGHIPQNICKNICQIIYAKSFNVTEITFSQQR